MADIRDPEAFIRGRWAWGAGGYDACFPGRMAIGDIDGMIEVSGHHLIIEAKHAERVLGDASEVLDGMLPTGQRLALERLAVKPAITVLLLIGDATTNDPMLLRMMRAGLEVDTDLRAWELEVRREQLRNTFREWVRMARADSYAATAPLMVRS